MIQTRKKSRIKSFCDRAANGKYIRIPTKEHIIFIATRQFTKDKRENVYSDFKYQTINKKRFINEILQGILEKKSGEHISRSKGFLPPEPKSEGNSYAKISGNKVKEYERLKSDKDRAVWLDNHRMSSGCEIYKKGEQFIKQFKKSRFFTDETMMYLT